MCQTLNNKTSMQHDRECNYRECKTFVGQAEEARPATFAPCTGTVLAQLLYDI